MKKLVTLFAAASLVASCGLKTKESKSAKKIEEKSNSKKVQNVVNNKIVFQQVSSESFNSGGASKDTTSTSQNDGDVSSSKENTSTNTFRNLEFDSERPYTGRNRTANQIAFLLGYITAKHLSNNRSIYDYSGSEGLKIGVYGGVNTEVVTKYITGFQQGIKYWNENISEDQNTVEFINLGSSINNYLTNSFVLGEGTDKTVEIINEKADFILPVSGGQVKDTISYIESNNLNVQVIGLDKWQNFWVSSEIKEEIKSLWLNAKDQEKVLTASQEVKVDFQF